MNVNILMLRAVVHFVLPQFRQFIEPVQALFL